jgi:hypothetical protein
MDDRGIADGPRITDDNKYPDYTSWSIVCRPLSFTIVHRQYLLTPHLPRNHTVARAHKGISSTKSSETQPSRGQKSTIASNR